MRRVLISVLLTVFILGVFGCADDTHKVGPLKSRGSHIVGGEVFTGLPAVGALVYDGYAHCTGTVIAPRTVITAAHCVSGYSASKMQFVIGPNFSSVEHVIQATSLRAHSSYNSSSITNDIGVVTLAEDAPVEPMKLLEHMDSSFVGEELFFVGYGVSDGYKQTGSGIKRAAWMEISQVNSTSFRYEPDGINTCNGDSGGPAFLRTSDGELLLAGVTSYGDQYCVSYGVDTRIDAYLDFCGISGGDDGTDPCQGETYEGRCQGNSVVWCENQQVHTQNCSEQDKTCGFSAEQNYYGCLEGAPQDPCQGETYEGRCDGGSVIWCEDGEIKTLDCADNGHDCGWNDSGGYYDCL